MYESSIFVRFSKLVSYPEIGIEKDTEALVQALSEVKDDADKLKHFSEFICNTQHADIEELFTRTFDLNPSCCLEVGWHLYGEDYGRGEFLVRMRQSLAEENLPETGELPDHLSHCLLFLTRLESEDAHEFTKSYLLPAIAKILVGFGTKESNPYQNLIEVLQAVLKRNYEIRDEEVPHPALKVLNNMPGFHTKHIVNNKIAL